MPVEMVFPNADTTGLESLVKEARSNVHCLDVGDSEIINFFAGFSRHLIRSGQLQKYPELADLSTFCRRSSLEEVAERLRGDTDTVLRVPQGLVFQIVPSNVPSILFFTWAISAIAGNVNVVRVPSETSEVLELLLAELRACAEGAPDVVGRTQFLLRYPRHSDSTRILSEACDVRVVWGGDATVSDVRDIPISPSASDLSFGDRSSLAVFSANAWHEATNVERSRVARDLAHDVLIYDQSACASPRSLVWIGEHQHALDCQNELAVILDDDSEGLRKPDPSHAVERQVRVLGLAADGIATGVSFSGSNRLCFVSTELDTALACSWNGVGTIMVSSTLSLNHLSRLVRRRHQTLSYFGIDPTELKDFVRSLRGRGLDRIVPIGSAHRFSLAWDGLDLTSRFTRSISVPSSESTSA